MRSYTSPGLVAIACTVCFQTALCWAAFCLPSYASSDTSFKYFIDPTGDMTLAQVHKKRTDFLPLQTDGINLGFQHGAVWVTRIETGSHDRATDRYIFLDKIHIRNVDLFQLSDGHLTKHLLTGTDLPFSTRAVPIPQWAFPFAAGESGEYQSQEVYLRLHTRSPMQFSASVRSISDLIQLTNRHTLYYSVVLGFFLLLFFMSSALVYITRQKVMWLGLLIMVGACAEILASSGLGFNYLWPNLPSLNPLVSRLAINLTLGATALFCVEYLQIPRVAHKLSKATQIAALILIGFSAFPVAALSPAVLMAVIAAVILTALLCIGISIQQQVRGGTLLLFGFLAFLSCSILEALSSVTLLSGPIAYGVIFDTGLVVMTLTMAYSLVRRIRDQTLDSAANREGMKAKTLFFASVSHELRTPINGVIGMLNLMMRDSLSDPQKRLAIYAKTSAESLLSLINDILDISKFEAGKLDVEVIEFDVVRLLEETIESFACLEANKHLSLILDTSELKTSRITSDPSRFRQILNNLLSNALKFTKNGEIEVIASFKERHSQQYLEVSIRDTGIGISAEQLPKLFSTFTQADQSTTRKFGGTGLGLSIVKQLCQLLDGNVIAKSQPGVGSVFTFQVSVTLHKQDKQVDDLELSGQVIAIHHENTAAAKVVEMYLTQWGANVIQSPSMKSFLQTVISKRPDIALSSNAPARIHSKRDTSQREAPENSPFALPLGNSITESSIRRLIETKPAKQVAQSSNDEQISKPFKLLLVEDNFINTEVAIGMLEDEGYSDIEHAENGQEAIEKCMQRQYDLVLMDCQMPVVDGYEATRNIRSGKAGANKDVPVIAMTANAMQGDREKCLEVGMNDYLTKPIDPDKLSYTLQSWLSG